MTPTLLEGPAIEPVSLADMKAYLRISAPDEDAVVASLIAAARLTVEAASGLTLIAQRWRVALDRWPAGGVVRLPLRPIIACEAARVFVDATTSVAIDPAGFTLDAYGAPPRLVFSAPPPSPGRAMSAIELDLLAGFGATPETVPPSLRQAIRMLAARWFERRGDEPEEGGDARLPGDVARLVAAFREPRI